MRIECVEPAPEDGGSGSCRTGQERMKPIRIAIVQRIIPHYRVGIFKQLQEYLSQRFGANVCVYYGDHTTHTEEISGFQCKMLKTFYIEYGGDYFVFQPSLIPHLIFERRDVIICEFGISILSNMLALVYTRIWGKKFIWWGSDWGIRRYVRVSFRSRVEWWVRRLLARYADALIAYDERSRETFSKHLHLPPRKIFVALNAIDTGQIDAVRQYIAHHPEALQEIRDRLGLNGKKVVLFIGRLLSTKKVDHLIEAIAALKSRVPEVALIIIGDGPARHDLQILQSRLGLNDIYFVGSITEPLEVGKYFSVSELFVLPGLGGLAANQAVAYGKPVIVSDIAEAECVIHGKNGLVIPHDSLDGLVRALHHMLTDDCFRRTCAYEAEKLAKDRFNLTPMLKGFSEAIFFVIRERG